MKSQVIVRALVVLYSALSVNSSPTESYIPSKAEQNLMEYVMKTRQGDELELSPDVVPNLIPCFHSYLPILNSVTETYQKNTQDCSDTADKQMAALIAESTKVRANITAISKNVSDVLSNCQSKVDTLDFFDCYASSGDQTVRQVYSISENSSEGAANYRETVRVITTKAENCTKEVERVYSVDVDNVHKELDDCLVNGLKTTTAPTTTV